MDAGYGDTHTHTGLFSESDKLQWLVLFKGKNSGIFSSFISPPDIKDSYRPWETKQSNMFTPSDHQWPKALSCGTPLTFLASV